MSLINFTFLLFMEFTLYLHFLNKLILNLILSCLIISNLPNLPSPIYLI